VPLVLMIVISSFWTVDSVLVIVAVAAIPPPLLDVDIHIAPASIRVLPFASSPNLPGSEPKRALRSAADCTPSAALLLI